MYYIEDDLKFFAKRAFRLGLDQAVSEGFEQLTGYTGEEAVGIGPSVED